MNRPFRFNLPRWLLTGLLMLTAWRSYAQRRVVEEVEPRWLRLDIPETSVGLDVEGLKEDQTTSGITSTHENFTLVPLVGLKAHGSVYHPNLMTFDFDGLGGVGWAKDTVTSTGYSQVRNENQNLFLYVASANFLASKPYNASFFASQDHNYNNYDFFNTMTVDSTRYGGRLSWTVGNFILTSDMGYRDQTSSGMTGNTEVQDTYLNFNGLNQRQHGSSSVSYSYDDSINWVNSGPAQESRSSFVGATDTEILGKRDQIIATTGASYGQAEYPGQNAERFSATENVTDQHSQDLSSFLHLNFTDSQFDFSSVSQFQGMVGLRHQLYESLTSILDLHGNYDNFSSLSTSAINDRIGVGLGESYTKRLAPGVQLSLGGIVIADHLDQETYGGATLTAIGESHVLTDSTPVPLNHPLVIVPTIFVTGPNGVPTYVNGVDYEVFQTGDITRLQRIPTSVLLPNGGSVLVSYQYQAPATASYESMSLGFTARLELYNTYGVYTRYNTVQNNAPPAALAETVTDFVGGADVRWRWLRAGAEYENYNSSFTEYRANRLFETFTFALDEASNLSLDFNQVWYLYANNQDQTQYQFRCIFNTQVSSWLFWNIEGGYYLIDTLGVQQNFTAARTSLDFNWGKLTARLGYQYNYEATQQSASNSRNFFYFHLKRAF